MFDMLIINPFITFITFLYAILGNQIVLAIIVFTLVVRVLTYPLTIQQQRSTKATQKIQPQLKKLKEKYKGDREKFSQAQMALYREHKINPLGGCLPLVIQMPILLGLYSSIMNVLASTPTQLISLNDRLLIPSLGTLVPLEKVFLGMDLTLPPTANPFYALALPILVMGSTFLQSKMTMGNQPKPEKREDGKPDQSAAMQKSMTTMMPLMFGFFSLSFSVGLSVYFVVSNLIGIAQYGWMGRQDKQREAEAEEEARMMGSKRRRRRHELTGDEDVVVMDGGAPEEEAQDTAAEMPRLSFMDLLRQRLAALQPPTATATAPAVETTPEPEPATPAARKKGKEAPVSLSADEAQRRKERRQQLLSNNDNAETGD